MGSYNMRCSIKKSVFKNFEKFTGKSQCQYLFLITSGNGFFYILKQDKSLRLWPSYHKATLGKTSREVFRKCGYIHLAIVPLWLEEYCGVQYHWSFWSYKKWQNLQYFEKFYESFTRVFFTGTAHFMCICLWLLMTFFSFRSGHWEVFYKIGSH